MSTVQSFVSSRNAAIWFFVVTLLCALALHLDGLDGAFLSDDFAHLDMISAAADRSSLWSWLLSLFYGPYGGGNFAYRPVAFATYTLDWLTYRADATGWHISNLLLHATNAMLAGFVTARWLRPYSSRAYLSGMITACVLAAYPFAGEISFWLSGRFDLLACLFSLLYLSTLSVQGERSGMQSHVLRLVWLACALLSKESAMPLPAIATLLCLANAFADDTAMPARTRHRIEFALKETGPTWLAFGLYLVWRKMLFGSFWKVYPDSTLPHGMADLVDRLSAFRFIVEETIGAAHVIWSIAAIGILAMMLGSWIRTRRSVPPSVSALILALVCCTTMYALAPAFSFPVASFNGEGARNYYVPWAYLSLLSGVLLAWQAWQWPLGLAFVSIMLVGQSQSLLAWHSAGRQMKRIVAGVEPVGQRILNDQYALLLLPDHYGIAPFARNAQGPIVSRPTQRQNYLDRVAVMTSPSFQEWTTHIQQGTIAKLKGVPEFDPVNFVGLYCWNPAKSSFVLLTSGGLAADPVSWRNAAETNFARAGCMSPF